MGLACLFGHKWDGCRCVRCGEIRDEGHNYTHFRPSNTGKCVGTCKCGKKQELEHDWVGGKCARCGLRWDDTYEYAISMMDEKNYYEAYKCFERIEKGPFGGSYAVQKNNCITQAYEHISNLIAQNDYTHFDYVKHVSGSLFQMEANRKTFGKKSYTYTEKVDEQICSVIKENIDKKDYKSVRGWINSLNYLRSDICKSINSDTMNDGLYGVAQQCIDEKEYKEALEWLQALPDDYPNRTEKLEECEKCWQHDSRNPVFCPKSTDGIHRWESVPGSEKKIINGVTNPIYYTERCVYCGREERREYVDYDAIREAYKYNY